MIRNFQRLNPDVDLQLSQEQKERVKQISKSGNAVIGQGIPKDAEPLPGSYTHFIQSCKEYTAWREASTVVMQTRKEVDDCGKDDCPETCSGCNRAYHQGGCWDLEERKPIFWETLSDED